MPIYGYLCDACGFQKDILQKMSDEPLTRCPSCQQNTLVKQISAPNFRLSGSGWYETDFKTGQKKNLTGEQADASSQQNNSADSNKETAKNVTKDAGSHHAKDGKKSAHKKPLASHTTSANSNTKGDVS